MIIRQRPTFWELFGIFRLSILPRIAPQVGLLMVFSAGVVSFWPYAPLRLRGFSVAPFTLLGIAISIFLGFRNNACYDRWWEARKQLGALIGEMRSLARLTLTVRGGDRARREGLVRGAIAYTYALMAELRGEAMPEEVRRYAPGFPVEDACRVPDGLLRGLGAACGDMLAEEEFGEVIFHRFDERLAAVAAIQVACERIRGTPTPFIYTLLLHRTAYAFCFLLPFGLVGTMGYATPIFCGVVAYTFFGLDALGDELEEPFGPWANALPLSAMARTVEISLLESLGEREIPEPLTAVDSVLR